MKLKRAGHEKLFDKFEFIVCCSTDPEVKQGKPHPDAFDVARRRFSPIPDPEKCLAFEDSTNGVKSAIAAGMQCVMVPGNLIYLIETFIGFRFPKAHYFILFSDKRLKPEECANATIVLKSLEDFDPADFNLPQY